MIACRFLLLIIASSCLLTLLKGQDVDDRPIVEDHHPTEKEFEIELCDLPCANNGRCVAYDTNGDGILDPQCFCNTTFQGELCEIPRACSLACENGGTCNLGDAWWLDLDEPELEIFQELIYSCAVENRDCKLGQDMMFQERCDCPPGTNGELCETTCDKICLNDSECIFWGREQRCRCPPNFYGDQCENECTKDCQNGGLCLPDANGSGGINEMCFCPAGFEGDRCEVEIPCPLTCQNEGICKFYDAQRITEDESFEFLQSIMERCTSQDIPIAECFGDFFWEEEPQGFCECPPLTMGRNCEITCDLDCQNGSCEFYSREDQYCRCDSGFAGDLCEFQCTKNCGNMGVCKANATTEWCQCSPYFEGEFCETETPCDLTCQNGGDCVFNELYREHNEKYFEECLLGYSFGCPGPEDIKQCACTSDFVGEDCSMPCPCQNGGTCSTRFYYRNRMLQALEEENGNGHNENVNEQEPYYDDIIHGEDEAGYFCQCPFGYYGQDCEFQYDSENCVLDCQNGGYCQADFGWFDDDKAVSDYIYDYDDDGFAGEEVEENIDNSNINKDNDLPNSSTVNGRQNNSDEPYNSNGGYNNNVLTPPTQNQRPFEYCVCPDGFSGVSCEIKIDACDNQCKNGGVCTSSSSATTTGPTSTQGAGNRALQEYQTLPAQSPVPQARGFCSCPEGYSGEFCERKTCGSGYCNHGGTCIELPAGQTTSAGDDYVCDCSTSSLEGTVAIGRNCDSIVYGNCPFINSNKNPNEPWTCAGWGRCDWRDEDSSSLICNCDNDSFMGPRCEFNRTDPQDVAWSECNLECSNDGICLKGATKPIAEIFIPFLEATQKSGVFDYQTPDFEYCYCPDGFFGVQCDMQYDLCGNGEHICFHGSKCMNNGGEWGCDCDGTESAGLYCQYKATDDCGDSDAETFCTNDATCTNGVCACKEGWEGSKCEAEIKLAAPAGGGDSWSSASVTATFVSVLSLALLSVALSVG